MSARYGMVIDLDRCTGCGACMVACAAENNVPPAPRRLLPEPDSPRCWFARSPTARRERRAARSSFPITCMQCEHETPCVSVCPQQAVEVDKATGIVMQMPQRCLGCRYCMMACPYHARYFNWWDPAWPAGMEKSLNPGVAVRMRGVVEKCNMCHARLHSAMEKAAAAGEERNRSRRLHPRLRRSLSHRRHLVRKSVGQKRSRRFAAAHSPEAFRLLAQLGTEPKVHYKSTAGVGEGLGGARSASPRRLSMADLLVMDRRWIARGVERTSTLRFALWLVPWICPARAGNLCGRTLSLLRPEPDQHGQPLRLRPVDLLGSLASSPWAPAPSLPASWSTSSSRRTSSRC